MSESLQWLVGRHSGLEDLVQSHPAWPHPCTYG